MNKMLLFHVLGGLILLFEICGGLALPTNKVRTKRETDKDIISQLAKRSGEVSGMFFIHHLPELLNIKEYFKSLGNKASETTKCIACRIAIAVIQNRINTGESEDEIGKFAHMICTTFKIETPRVCTGVTSLFKRELTQVLANVVLEPNQICSFVFQGCGKVENPFHDWTIPLTPFPKPHRRPPHLPKPGSPTLRVLHISDVHIDPFYKENSSANCGEPLCCRATSGKPSRPEDAAGYWGIIDTVMYL
ncbi:putative sphingomyelin phosphodiesterase asm-3 [Trichonephila clavata]|uniref:Putative sphingomyelin phosphodiesterase asm-3 n=1 Tax=Trichonephila clavata TaxID=2740835 RepID=A0A8X6KY30_TRICU|nr:putative sphingomyelin phosphodiesterase asm-3 [Trichonephila clavata]